MVSIGTSGFAVLFAVLMVLGMQRSPGTVGAVAMAVIVVRVRLDRARITTVVLAAGGAVR